MDTIHYSDKGSGTPVVLLHGFCESLNIWNDLSEKISSSHRILCPDLPGFGQSKSMNEITFTLEDVAGILKSWLDKLEIKKCIMIGHSLGGYVTLAFAERFPERLEGLGLFHSTSYPDPAEKKETRNKVISYIKTYGVKQFTDTFIPGLFYNKSKEVQQSIDRLVEDAGNCSKEALIAYTKAMRDRPDRSHIMNKTLPILFIAGEKDSAVTIEQSREQTKHLNSEYVHFLPETGHMGMFERKEETTKKVTDFLKQF
jgi:pimeloyl-ACP methyl ester carboxylesterase